ncbi:hypothetical protein C7448_105192 [Tenacibaculum gallaicum]|uniref:Sugar lactone lactonase YvrE n=1 Tax=Tenacibaculum gallaicum TaxID=561505 RepID=A0A3E0HR64_9FLAO|nr:hypothetical protein [Tenacibaculum gallaicum]REH48909.1 hypothetical protein C7448_105192 [Tenacibaculum gallaicum]
MKHLISLYFVLCTLTVINAQSKLPFQLEKDWELEGLKNPESVVFDTSNQVLYVSNINGAPTDKDGNGFISKISLEGKLLELEWLKGFDAPKGLTIYKGKLYTTDINTIVEIDIATKQVQRFTAKDATFLNDIVADKKGNVYASNTFGFSGIYKLPVKGKRRVELWLKNDSLNMPNGLLIEKNNLIAAGWGMDLDPKTFATKTPGRLVKINLKTKNIEFMSKPFGNLDGLSETLHGFLITDWFAGSLLYFKKGYDKGQKVIDLPQGSADTYFDKTAKTLYIPLMLNNKLLKYHFKK